MPYLPYHEDNQSKKVIAFNDLACRVQQYLEGSITERELVEHTIMIMDTAGVKWD